MRHTGDPKHDISTALASKIMHASPGEPKTKLKLHDAQYAVAPPTQAKQITFNEKEVKEEI